MGINTLVPHWGFELLGNENAFFGNFWGHLLPPAQTQTPNMSKPRISKDPRLDERRGDEDLKKIKPEYDFTAHTAANSCNHGMCYSYNLHHLFPAAEPI
jgi:hypothetical protein